MTEHTQAHIKTVSDELAATGQVTPEDLQQAAKDGFKSVLNLRSPSEQGTLADEAQQAAAAGLEYANVPLNSSAVDEAAVEEALQEIENLPKPILVHCGAGLRAGGVALIATAINDELSLEEVKEKADEIGLSLDQPHLKQFIEKTYGDENASS